MTEVFLNDDKLELEDKQGNSTVGNLISAVEVELAAIDHIILDLKADGESKLEWRVPEFLDSSLGDLSELRIMTAPFDALMIQGLTTCRDFVDHLKDTLGDAVAKIREGREEEGFESLAEFFSATSSLIETINALYSASEQKGKALLSEPPVKYFEQLAKQLDELQQAQQLKDMVLVADLLEYEFLPIFDSIHTLILSALAK